MMERGSGREDGSVPAERSLPTKDRSEAHLTAGKVNEKAPD